MTAILLMVAVAVLGFSWAAWADSRERDRIAKERAARPTLAQLVRAQVDQAEGGSKR